MNVPVFLLRPIDHDLQRRPRLGLGIKRVPGKHYVHSDYDYCRLDVCGSALLETECERQSAACVGVVRVGSV